MDGTHGSIDGNGICFPYDVLLNILRRLPWHPLAESRRVCRTWRGIVDAHKLLLPFFFPRGPFPGIFTNNFGCPDKSSFFAAPPPRSDRPCDGPVFRRPLFRHHWASVLHHCNGLLLLKKDPHDCYVCNPATARCAQLPLPPQEPWLFHQGMFLAFDPAVSPHHEVFLLPRGKDQDNGKKVEPHEDVNKNEPQTWMEFVEQPRSPKLFEKVLLSQEDQEEIDIKERFDYVGESYTLPPPRLAVLAAELPDPLLQGHVSSLEQQQMHVQCVLGSNEPEDKVISMLVFSSRTNRWESREFVPGPCAPRPLYDMVTAPRPSYLRIWKSAEYWRGSLYIHCWNDIILILRNSNGVYDMARLPGEAYDDKQHLGSSHLPDRSILASYDEGVCYVVLDKFQLQIWTLTESANGQMGWMLAHEADLSPYNHEVQQWMEPRVPWEVAKDNEALIRLFEPCNIKKCIYDVEDDHSDTIGDSDIVCEDDEEGIHEVYGFDGTTNDGDDDGHDEEGDPHEYEEEGEFKSKEGCEYSWDSDEDNFIDQDESAAYLWDEEYCFYKIIGLHPHKKAVLFQTSGGVVAYHLWTSRMQSFGHRVVKTPHSYAYCIKATFPYRPCYVDVLPATKITSNLYASSCGW